MRHYLSFGAGVNSVALYILMQDQGYDFEAVFSDVGAEWPETYHYLAMFQWWTKANGMRSVTILRPEVEGTQSLIKYCQKYTMVPSFMHRWCTEKFKVRPMQKYQQAPAFVHIGIASDESHRARISSANGFENRYLLVEHEIDREGCKRIIAAAGLPIPRKSGCYICPFQRTGQWKELRRNHPEKFCVAQKLERTANDKRKAAGKVPVYLSPSRKQPITEAVSERQAQIFEQDEYPPCLCGM